MKLSAPVTRLKRQARTLARATKTPLHKALDQVAQEEGFQSWSHLAATLAASPRPDVEILSQLVPGDLVLLGARPAQGKTLLGLGLALEAAKAGRPGFFFTLEDNEEVVLRRARSLGAEPENLGGLFALDTSDDICADYVVNRLKGVPGNAVAVIDYLQLLDQRRSNAELDQQIRVLKKFAVSSNSIIVVISQIDRSFDPQAKGIPDLSDVRVANPLELGLFTKTCFLHDGEFRLEVMG